MLGLGKSLLRPDYVNPFYDPSSYAGLVTWYDASDIQTLYSDATTNIVFDGDIANGVDETGAELYKITNKWNAAWVDVGGNSTANGPYFGSQLTAQAASGDKVRIRSAGVGSGGSGLVSPSYWFIQFPGPTSMGGGGYQQSTLYTTSGGTINYANMTVFVVLSHMDGDANPSGEQIFLHAWGRNNGGTGTADARAWQIATSGGTDRYYLNHYEGAGGGTAYSVVNSMAHGSNNTEDGSVYAREPYGVYLYANLKSYAGSSNAGTSIMTLGQMQGASDSNAIERYPNLTDDGRNQVAEQGCGMRLGGRTGCVSTFSNQGASTGFKGRFYELIIYERSLADWEASTVLSYLGSKWAHIRK